MNNKNKNLILIGFLCVILGSTAYLAINPTTDDFTDSVSIAGANIVDDYGRLQVNNAKVTAEDGRQITLGGMSLFWSNWAPEWYNAQTVDYLVDTMKVSVIRAAYGVPLQSDDPTDPLGPSYTEAQIEAVVDAAINRGIYVIIDYHGEGDMSIYENEAKIFFASMAQKYGNTPNVMYELWNEPTDQPTSTIQTYHQNVANEIRKYDSDNLIICGSGTWSQYPQSYTITDPNAAYTFHGYFDDPSWGGAHMQQFYNNVQAAMDQGSAVFVTEFGANYGDTDGTDEIINAAQQMGISMCAWSVHDKIEPWSIFTNGGGLGSLTEWGVYLQGKFENWPGTVITDYSLNTAVSGLGTVTPSSGLYTPDASVSLTATPSAGWKFDHWEGDLTGNANPGIITMDASKMITAVFIIDSIYANIALNKPVSVSSTETTSVPGSNAVDGDTTTRWASAFSDPQWIYVDLQDLYDINRVVLNWEDAYSSNYVLQVSNDASSWTDVYSNPTADGGVDDISLTITNIRYVRMYATARGTAYGHSLWEFGIYGSLSATQQYTLTTSVVGIGEIQISPAGGTYAAGTSITLTVIHTTNSNFVGWSGDLSGLENPKTFTINSNMNVIATITTTDPEGGDVTMQDVSDIKVGDEFSTTIYVDTGIQKVAAYGIDITFDPAILQVTSIVASVNGFVAATNIDNDLGILTIAGFDTTGKGPDALQDIFIINWQAIAEGNSIIGIQVNDLTDENTEIIGTPNGIDNSILVEPPFALGDVNHDGSVNIVDALLVAQYYVGLPISGETDQSLMDVNEDAIINIVDALLIAQYYVGLIPELPPSA